MSNIKFDEMGDPVMLVKTEWVLNIWRYTDRDGACKQCYPEIPHYDEFVCYKHQAEAIEKENNKS